MAGPILPDMDDIMSKIRKMNIELNSPYNDGYMSWGIKQDLYILKSQIVPPVCPACPAASSCPRQEACPPCPACERCPEPAFECKKVPNYASSNENYLPRPIMADFSQFGM